MSVTGHTILIASLLLFAQFSSAVKMDETTHDQVIRRLEMGFESLEKTEPARTAVMVRMADLYADRARIKAMNEIEAGCGTQCKAGKDDRQRAIDLYNEALRSVDKDQQGRTILQIAHLYALNDQTSKSRSLYEKVLSAKRGTYSSEVLAIANSSLGEHYFRKADFKKSLRYFEAARKENLKNRALVEFRIAWCQLNLGKNKKAIATLVKLLKSPDLLLTNSTDGKTVDASFVQDISSDLAKFLATEYVGPKQIKLLRDLSPDKMRKSNLHTLGTETDRLGKKSASLVVWAAYVDEGEVQPNEKLEVQTRVTKIFYDMNKLGLAANAYEKTTTLWQKHGCKDNPELCDELKKRLRSIVTAWNKAQKKKPTTQLLKVYTAYTSVFTDDTEMLHWGAVVATSLKRHKEAISLFHRAALQAHADLKTKPKDKSTRNIFEGSLLGEIEMAEASKDKKAQEAAYNFYLEINPSGQESFNVRYQRAQLYYSTNRFKEAYSEFHYLASMPDKSKKDLRVKAADLALDSLVVLKDDEGLQVRSLEYARFFPERKKEYLKISRNATLNIVARNLKNEKANNRSDYKTALLALDKVNMEGADDAERIKFFKNKIVVAQKALELDAVTASAGSLLAIRSLDKTDKEWALAQKVWVAELQLDFKEAYRLTKQMKLPHLSKADRHLRLALLAELSGRNANKHYQDYLRTSPPLRSANLVRITLIQNAKHPWGQIDKHLKQLKKTPDLLAGITLETYARFKNQKRAKKLLRSTRIARYSAGQTLRRHLELGEFHKFDRKIRKHRLHGYSEAAMASTLKARMKLIAKSDRQAQDAFNKRDWTLQVLSLSQLSRENRRLYQDINKLPIPRRLNAKQRAEYQQLLKTQSQPYLARAEKIEAELNQMWSDSNSLQNLQAAYMTATPELRRLYRDEITPLAQNAPSRAKNRLHDLLNTPYKRPSQKDILVARRALQADPMDISKAQNLRQLEARSGRPAMVVYLDERISQLKKGKSL